MKPIHLCSRFAVYALVGWAVLTTVAFADQTAISGRVTSSRSGAGLPGANVEAEGGVVRQTIARADGRYELELPEGRYIVRVTHVGFLPQTSEVEVRPGRPSTVDFVLAEAIYKSDEIVVSASRKAENTLDAPASITKIRSEEIVRDASVASVAGLLRNTKGITYTQLGMFDERPNARGYTTTLYERLLLMVDGRLAFGVGGFLPGSIPKDDIESVEVIVGPEAALYGPDAVSGIVSVATKDPMKSKGTSVSMAGGNRRLFRGRVRHAGSRDQWAWKFSGEGQRAREYDVAQTFYNADSSVAVSDDPDPTARSWNAAAGIYYYPRIGGTLSLQGGAAWATMINYLNTGRIQRKGMTRDFLQLRYNSRSWHFNLYRTVSDNGESYALHSKARNIIAGLSPAEAEARATTAFKSIQWVAESRYARDVPFLRTHIDIGADYRKTTVPETTIHSSGIEIDQAGFFGRVESGSEKLRAIVALRLDKSDGFDDQFSPKAGFVFRLREDVSIRTTISRAYRSPNLNHQFLIFPVSSSLLARGNLGFSFTTVDGSPLPAAYEAGIRRVQPEVTTTYEVGLKSLLANRAFLDLTLFASRYKNFISPLRRIGSLSEGIVTVDETGLPRVGEQTLTYINFGRQRAAGFDLGLELYASEKVILNGNLSYVRAGRLDDAAGINQPFNTPSFITNAGAKIRDFIFPGCTFDVAARHVTAFDYSEGVHVGRVPTYVTLDTNFAYRSKSGTTYRLSARNLLADEHIEVPDGARIGRTLVAEMQYEF